jgi:hypothetical protein
MSAPAWAQGEIQKVRLGGGGDYDRLVFDLGRGPIDVYTVEGDRYTLAFEATPPSVGVDTEDKLSALGISIERSGQTTQIAVDKRGRSFRVFRLPAGDSATGDRIVMDISKKKGTTLEFPQDAQRVPERSDVAAATPRPNKPKATPKPPADEPVIPGEEPKRSVRAPEPEPEPTPREPKQRDVASNSIKPTPPSKGVQEEVWVKVRSIDFDGVGGEAPSRDDLLNLELNVGVADNGDLVAPRADLPLETLTLRAITSDDREKARVGGSLLQQIVERIADEYEERGKYGTRIDISKRDLERLLKDQDGRLVIRISEPSDNNG